MGHVTMLRTLSGPHICEATQAEMGACSTSQEVEMRYCSGRYTPMAPLTSMRFTVDVQSSRVRSGSPQNGLGINALVMVANRNCTIHVTNDQEQLCSTSIALAVVTLAMHAYVTILWYLQCCGKVIAALA